MFEKNKLDSKKFPNHIAFIIDGNGRWAKQRGLPRSMGHRAGIVTCKEIINECFNLGINFVSIYGFSTENWNRPKDEIDTLFELFRDFIRKTGSSSLMYIRPLFSTINSENLEKIIKEVSLRNGLEMNDNLESYIYNIFDYHHNKLATIMDKEYQGGSIKNDTEKSVRRI